MLIFGIGRAVHVFKETARNRERVDILVDVDGYPSDPSTSGGRSVAAKPENVPSLQLTA